MEGASLDSRFRRLLHVVALGALLVVTVAAYARALDGEFQFDDRTSIVENAAIKDLGAFLRNHFVVSFAGGQRPITDLTFALDYAAGRLDPSRFHVTNVLIHLLTVLAAWGFARVTFRDAGWSAGAGVSVVVGGLFALHPLQSEAVAYICQRAETLASLAYLVTLLLLVEADRRQRTRAKAMLGAAALAVFVAGIGAKMIVVTAPAAFLLHRALFCSDPAGSRDAVVRRWASRAALALPLAGVGALYAARLVTAMRGSEHVGFDMPSVPAGSYVLTQPRVVATYLRLLFWPAGQSIDHPFAMSRSLLEPSTLSAVAFVAALVALAALLLWDARRRAYDTDRAAAERVASFGILWFLLVLAPTSSVVPLRDVLVEHRIYLASWGIFVAAIGIAALALRRGLAPSFASWMSALAATVVLAALGITLHTRNAVWETERALWSDAVAKAPRHARARMNLASALERAGVLEGAVREYRLALELPGEGLVAPGEIRRNLGAALGKLGRFQEAIAVLEHALSETPGHPEMLNNLAICYLETGRLDEAERTTLAALAVAPKRRSAHNTLGDVLLARGRLREARDAFEYAARLDVDATVPVLNVALVSEQLGDTTAACGAWARYAQRVRDGASRVRASERRAALGCMAEQ